MTSLERYEWARTTPSDITEHVPTLLKYGAMCDSICEFGVRGGVSTSAWLHAKPKKLVCYDQNMPQCLDELYTIANENGTEFHFILSDTSNVRIEETDLLFVDSLHTDKQVTLELCVNTFNVKRFVLLHDTETFGWNGENGQPGIKIALIHFLLGRTDWRIKEHFTNNNGLTILERL